MYIKGTILFYKTVAQKYIFNLKKKYQKEAFMSDVIAVVILTVETISCIFFQVLKPW